jgi:hypothetical protein
MVEVVVSDTEQESLAAGAPRSVALAVADKLNQSD